MNHLPTAPSSAISRLSAAIRRLLVASVRTMALWCGAKPPPGGWRDEPPRSVRSARPIRRSHFAARERERRETRGTLIRLLVWLPLGWCVFFSILLVETPEQSALRRLRSAAVTNGAARVVSVTPRLQDYPSVAFDELASFDFTVTPDIYDGRANPAAASAKVSEQIPDSVKRKDGLPVALQGFMLPFKLEKGKAVEWLLCRDQSDCCFGKTPRMNHWVLVRSPHGVKPKLGQPVTCSGTLRVGEMRDDGFLTGIYQMDAVDTRLTK